MNDLDLMAKFRADLPPADADRLAHARARMFRTEAPPRRSSRWVWRVAPAAGLAAAVLVTVVVVRPHETVPPGSSGTTSAQAPPSSDAAQVFRLAAAEARREPSLTARPDQFVYVESEVKWAGGRLGKNGQAPVYLPPAPKNRQIWLSVDGRRPGLLREKFTQPAAEPHPPLNNEPLEAGQAGYRRDLPTDAKAMRAYLYEAGRGGDSPDSGAFSTVTDLLREQYVPSASVAALYDAAATIPGTTVVKQVDMAGRHGTAVSRVDRAGQLP